MNIGLDLGFGYVKGINDQNKKVLFPSIVSMGFDRPLSGLFNTSSMIENLHVRIIDSDGENSYYVGDLAKREGFSNSFSLDMNKFTEPEAKALLSTATLLLTTNQNEPINEPINLVTGLPLKQFLTYKNNFEKDLQNYRSVISLPEYKIMKTIEFEKVTIFPQAAGAVYYALLDNLDKYFLSNSYIVLIDIGFKTTDYIVFFIDDNPHFLEDMSGTIDVGISNIFTAMGQIYNKKTGSNMDTTDFITILNKQSVFFKGKYIDFSEEIATLDKELAKLIEKTIYTNLKGILDKVLVIFVAGGGGADLYPYLKNLHENVELVRDAQFANALGFLKVAELNK